MKTGESAYQNRVWKQYGKNMETVWKQYGNSMEPVLCLQA